MVCYGEDNSNNHFNYHSWNHGISSGAPCHVLSVSQGAREKPLC